MTKQTKANAIRNEIRAASIECVKRGDNTKVDGCNNYWLGFEAGLRKAIEIIDWHAQSR